jgi:tyrosyl-tRNA synthetase
MTLSAELQARGFIHQNTAEQLSDITDQKPRVVYHGFDPSADSIHAGNFVQWVLLRHLANHGHKVVLLVGGATGRIGDPKPDSERPLISEEEIERRIAKMKAQAEKLLGGTVELVNNYDWFKEIKFIDFLRDIGKHFTVNELIKKDAIATRLSSEVGLSYTEFAYPLVQGFDYLTLFRTKGCTLQTGGSDQWGNMVAGVELVRRIEHAEAHVITTPIITDKTTGKKFGKSEGNAVWLDPEKTSPYEFYQFWLNVSDENVIDYLKLFTFLSLEKIADLEQAMQQAPAARVAQKALAQEVTQLVHGELEVEKVQAATEVLFSGGAVALSALAAQTLWEAIPSFSVNGDESIIDLLVATEMASSKREAREFITAGAIKVGATTVTAEDKQVTEWVADSQIIRRGKKRYCMVRRKTT